MLLNQSFVDNKTFFIDRKIYGHKSGQNKWIIAHNKCVIKKANFHLIGKWSLKQLHFHHATRFNFPHTPSAPSGLQRKIITVIITRHTSYVLVESIKPNNCNKKYMRKYTNGGKRRNCVCGNKLWEMNGSEKRRKNLIYKKKK
jgi:hypothetical protein